ncbi:MAG: sortase domain-bontaining protein [Anaerolineae bacterium]
MTRKVGTALLVLGLLALLAAAAMVGYDQVQRALMRRQVEALRQTPVATPLPPTDTAVPSPTVPEPAATPSPTVAVSTATASPTARKWTASPSPTAQQPMLTPTETAPAPQRRTATPTRMSTAAPPTPTPPPAPLPPARPVRMAVPAIGLDIPVVEVAWVVQERNGVRTSTWETASYAAGHHVGSANPGEPGNVVLSGHHNIEGEVFREISNIGEPGARLGLGDEVILYRADGQAFVYRIVEWHRFREAGTSAEEQRAHAQFLEPSSEPILTLVTCWPYVSNTHRVVVVAELVGRYGGP